MRVSKSACVGLIENRNANAVVLNITTTKSLVHARMSVVIRVTMSSDMISKKRDGYPSGFRSFLCMPFIFGTLLKPSIPPVLHLHSSYDEAHGNGTPIRLDYLQ